MAALQRLARRSAASGAALAQGVADLADQARLDAGDAARAAAERASVLIAGPLGLCYLPAFVCLGIVPVVAGWPPTSCGWACCDECRGVVRGRSAGLAGWKNGENALRMNHFRLTEGDG